MPVEAGNDHPGQGSAYSACVAAAGGDFIVNVEFARTRVLTWWSGSLAAVTMAIAVSLAIAGPAPPIVPLLLLGALVACTEHLVLLRPPTSILGTGVMLSMTAVVVFRDDGALLGPMVVAMCGAVFVPHLRARAWAKIAFNLGYFGLSAAAAAAVYGALDPLGSTTAWRLVAGIPASAALVAVNLMLMTVLIAIRDGRTPRRVLFELAPGNLEVIPLALFGVLLGELALDLNALVVPLFVAPLVIARQTYSSAARLEAAHEAVLTTLTAALEVKDRYTAGHAARVAVFADYIADELGLGPRARRNLRFAALVHDFGKLVVPNSLLNKPTALTPEEFEVVRRHEELSRELLAGIDFLAPRASEVVGHQDVDDFEGKPTVAHVVAVADAFDAMTSTRSYRRALSQEVAFAELRDNIDVQFHRRCAEALIAAVTRRGEHYGAGYEVDPGAWPVPPPARGTGSAGLGDLAPGWEGAR